MSTNNETIVALATPPGEGAIGIIRLSGNDAFTIADKIFSGKQLADQPSHTIHFGRIKENENVIDEVVASIYKNPKSYTGEDVVEFSCHGSNFILQKIIELCTNNGAVLAKPGEFTQRAFLNGKLDLTQAEAVADLIASESNASHQAAMYNLRGGFSNDLKIIRDELIEFSALIELELDFSQEDVEFADRKQLNELLNRANAHVMALLNSFQIGNAIKNGVKVAIVGKPNAGKSTLLNALVNEERAIVSAIAGTTRDTIEETLNINGILFRFIDTAGIRDHSVDLIENIGIARSKKAMTEANLVILLFDVNDAIETVKEELKLLKDVATQFILVGNKTDEQQEGITKERFSALSTAPIVFISAKEKVNINELKDALYDLVAGGTLKQEGTIVTNARHFSELQKVQTSLQEIQSGLDSELSGELVALDIRKCLFHLGTITGEVQVDRDILGAIFGKFCIGK